jgi:phosphomevalonate kinase
MSDVIRTSAPGKLVAAGEYAVLEGYPAIATAVDVRATCTMVPSNKLSVTGMGIGPLPIVQDGHGARIPDDPEDAFSLCRHVIDQVCADGPTLPPFAIHLETSAMGVRTANNLDVKLGVGSSAAIAAALAGALLFSQNHLAKRNREVSKEVVFAKALAAHRQFSSGTGSGIDVATSCFGGWIKYTVHPSNPMIQPTPPPPGSLDMLLVYSGRGQDTRAFLKKIDFFRQKDRAAYDAHIRKVADAAKAFQRGCSDQDGTSIIESVRQQRFALQELGNAAGIDIISAPHQEIASLAEALGGSAKPSGAGGGDVALAFVPTSCTEELRRNLSANQYSVLDEQFGAQGIRQERT